MLNGALVIFLTLATITGMLLLGMATLIFNDAGTAKLVAFSLGVGMVSLLFPKIAKPLPKDAVDFWYYFLAIVAVVLFYFHDSAQRTAVERYDVYQELLERKSELEQELRALELIISKPKDAIGVLSKRSRSLANAAAAHVQLVCGEEMLSFSIPFGKSPQFDPERKAIERAARALACAKLLEAKLEEKWNALAGALESGELSKIKMTDFAKESAMVAIGDAEVLMRFALSSVLEVSLNPGSGQSKLFKANLISDKFQIEEDIRKLESQHVTPPSLAESKPGLSDITVFYAWPYLLVLLLGLKLARVRYI